MHCLWYSINKHLEQYKNFNNLMLSGDGWIAEERERQRILPPLPEECISGCNYFTGFLIQSKKLLYYLLK